MPPSISPPPTAAYWAASWRVYFSCGFRCMLRQLSRPSEAQPRVCKGDAEKRGTGLRTDPPSRGHSFKGLAPAEGPDAFRWGNRGLPQVQINMHFLLIA